MVTPCFRLALRYQVGIKCQIMKPIMTFLKTASINLLLSRLIDSGCTKMVAATMTTAFRDPSMSCHRSPSLCYRVCYRSNTPGWRNWRTPQLFRARICRLYYPLRWFIYLRKVTFSMKTANNRATNNAGVNLLRSWWFRRYCLWDLPEEYPANGIDMGLTSYGLNPRANNAVIFYVLSISSIITDVGISI